MQLCTSSLMHSHDRSETDDGLACLPSVALGLALKEAMFRNNARKIVSQDKKKKKKKREWPQVHLVLVRQIKAEGTGGRATSADSGLASTSDGW